MEKQYFESFDNKKIPYLFFESKREKYKNNVVIFHGMTEPVDRYAEFGEFLASNGYNVFVMEIRGHGELKENEIGDFGKGGIKSVFKDIDFFFAKILSKVGATPSNTTIFGHSMGSLIGTRWGIKNKYKYFILSGFPLKNQLVALGGHFATLLERMIFKKVSAFNKFMEKCNANFEPNKTKFDWLTRDEIENKKYEDSELCGYPVTPKFYSGIFSTMGFINRNYKKLDEHAKILAVYGTDDKVIDIPYISKIFNILRKKKRRINILENKNGRHESLNETNKHEIYDEILKWLNAKDF
ncbi:lysophospholipase L2 [Leptotrichia trevisanii]|uniref:alpha/beta fold hydrolase n=1 Tax=Leptotrichia trevisanii TaxID=109328 RepID=UPI00118B61B4|nr:alpha/beta fold hydrolase [Leptotrichia trevisanii]BBM58177.1 lysophospholipase L2 [Leptotrichia trevisanii]